VFMKWLSIHLDASKICPYVINSVLVVTLLFLKHCLFETIGNCLPLPFIQCESLMEKLRQLEGCISQRRKENIKRK